jgi:hypothetical protein
VNFGREVLHTFREYACDYSTAIVGNNKVKCANAYSTSPDLKTELQNHRAHCRNPKLS